MSLYQPLHKPLYQPLLPASAASVFEKSEEFEQFQRYMALVKASDNMSVGFAQVGNVTEKNMSFVSVGDNNGKRFTLDPNKLYLDSCVTYHSTFVRNMLDGVKSVGTVLQGNSGKGDFWTMELLAQ